MFARPQPATPSGAGIKPICSFCKKNGESEAFYRSHKLKDENNGVTCPVLARYTCPNCKVTGSHTASYCPQPRGGQPAANVATSAKKRGLRQRKQPNQQSPRTQQKQERPQTQASTQKQDHNPPPRKPGRPPVQQEPVTFSEPSSQLNDFDLYRLLAEASRMVSWMRVPHLMSHKYNLDRLHYVQQVAKCASWLIEVELLQINSSSAAPLEPPLASI